MHDKDVASMKQLQLQAKCIAPVALRVVLERFVGPASLHHGSLRSVFDTEMVMMMMMMMVMMMMTTLSCNFTSIPAFCLIISFCFNNGTCLHFRRIWGSGEGFRPRF